MTDGNVASYPLLYEVDPRHNLPLFNNIGFFMLVNSYINTIKLIFTILTLLINSKLHIY